MSVRSTFTSYFPSLCSKVKRLLSPPFLTFLLPQTSLVVWPSSSGPSLHFIFIASHSLLVYLDPAPYVRDQFHTARTVLAIVSLEN